jgi:hypothetical protein
LGAHGVKVDGQLYLLPYNVDVSTPSHLEVSAIGANELKAELVGRITLFTKTAQPIPIH